jgi:PAS domain S-box-containing protein
LSAKINFLQKNYKNYAQYILLTVKLLTIMNSAPHNIATSKIQHNSYTDDPREYLAAIVTNSHDAIISKTLDGVITSWNPAAERMYGYKASEIIGKSIITIVPKEYRKDLKFIFSKLKKGIPIEHYEATRIRKDGTRIIVSLSISPIKNNKGNIIGAAVIARDISAYKQTAIDEQFIAQASTLLASSLDYNQTLQSIAKLAVPDLADWCAIDLLNEKGEVDQVTVAHIDPNKVKWARELRKKNPIDMSQNSGLPKVLKTGKSEFYPFISDEVIKLTNPNKRQHKLIKQLGLRSAIIVPLAIRNKTIGAITFVSTRNDNLYTERRLALAEDLARRASQAIDNATLFQQLQTELDERKKIEVALRESEIKYRKLFESSIIGVIVGSLDGKFIEVNQTFLNMLGYTRSDYEAGIIEPFNLTPEKWLSENARALEELRHYGEVSPWEKEYYHKDGSTVPILIGSTLLDHEKEIVLSFVLDISEQKAIERRKDDFISIASHELKTPVTSMKVFTQLLAKRFGKQEDESTVMLINKMDTQLNKLIVLISDLLDVSRIQSGKLALRPETFDFDQLVQETIESLEQTTNHTIEFNDGTSIKVEADRERIGQVITNFLTNAIKYSPDNKKIIVSVEHTKKDIKLGVKDFGLGISKEEQARIFDRFYQASSSEESTFPGLGMGLYICAEIIRRHGGKIWVESKKGKGSHFFFTIPLHNSLTIKE